MMEELKQKVQHSINIALTLSLVIYLVAGILTYLLVNLEFFDSTNNFKYFTVVLICYGLEWIAYIFLMISACMSIKKLKSQYKG